VQFQALAPTDPGHTHLITNTATVTDLAWGIGSPVMAKVLKAADLWVSKNGNSIIQDGATLVYTLTYGNAGPYDANSQAQVIDVLPAGVTYVGSTPPGMYDPAARTVTWNVGKLQANISGTLTTGPLNTLLLSVEVPAGTAPQTPLTNTVNISAIPQDPNAANNVDEALTTVNLFHLAKTAIPSQLSLDDVVTYTITLANGDDVTVTASLTDPIPAGAVYLPGSSTVNGVSTELYNDASQSIEWQGAVPPNSTTTLRLQAQITTTCATIVNSVRVKHIAGMISSRQATIHIVPCSIYLPILTKLYSQ